MDAVMDAMYIFHNCEEVHRLLGKTNVYFASTEDEENAIEIDRDLALARADFHGEIPRARLVEKFIRRAVLESPGEGGNDYVFVNAWGAPKTREQAAEDRYGPRTRA